MQSAFPDGGRAGQVAACHRSPPHAGGYSRERVRLLHLSLGAWNAPDGGLWRVAVDQTLRCRECGVDFIWTEGEQEFYASRGLTNPPSRCPS
ncbi:MAG: zinc-ribbon domain-containing protein, partial [Candidatus Dormibacteria bacterium]